MNRDRIRIWQHRQFAILFLGVASTLLASWLVSHASTLLHSALANLPH